jgi:hypothetical protein
MKGLSAWFFGTAVVYGIAGLVPGNIMGATQDHSQLPTHAHIMLIGWVSFAIFGYFYHAFPARSGGLLARLHFWLGQASYLTLIFALSQIFGGNPELGEPIAGLASIAYLISMVLFAVIALPVVRGRA